MKATVIVTSGLFAAMAAVSLYAAPGIAAAEKPVQVQESALANQAGEAAAKGVKPHSHQQEKTGMAPPASTTKVAAGTAAVFADRSKHFHPRDAK